MQALFRLLFEAINILLDTRCYIITFVIIEAVMAQAAQAHYLWVRASDVIWSEYTRIISVLSDAK